MKKTLIMLLALALILVSSCAFAEMEDDKPFIDFDIKMDSIPDGYTFDTHEEGGSLYAVFQPADPDAVVIYVSVAYSDEFAGYTLNSEIDAEQFAMAESILTMDYNDPKMDLQATEYGTSLIVITENDAQTDYADMIMLWKGYFIHLALQKPTEITDEDLVMARKVASDMWVVEQ